GGEGGVFDEVGAPDEGVGEGLGVAEAAGGVGDLGPGEVGGGGVADGGDAVAGASELGGGGGGQAGGAEGVEDGDPGVGGGGDAGGGARGRGGGAAEEGVDHGGGVGLLEREDVPGGMVGGDGHRQGVGGQLGGAERAEGGTGADDVAHPQGAVLGDLVNQGADEGVGPHRVGQALVEGGLDQCLEERLLAADAAQVGPRVAVPHPVELVGEVAAAGKGERPAAVEVAAGRPARGGGGRVVRAA